MTRPAAGPAAASSPASATSTPMGIAAAGGAVCAWGLGNTIIAGLPMSGLAIAFYRLLFAAVLYCGVLYARGGRLRRDSFRHGWIGGVAFGANIATFFVAIHLTTVANAVTISALQPLVIMGFAAVLFGERIRRIHVLCAVVATGGVALVTFGAAAGGTGSVAGDLMAVAALLTWAWYFISSKRARQHLDTLEYMSVMNVVAFLVVAPVALVGGDLWGSDGRLDVRRALVILAIVAVPGTGHILINWAHEHTTLVLTSLITLALPVISTTAAAVFLDQKVAAAQVVGIALVLVALAAVVVSDARITADATEPAA